MQEGASNKPNDTEIILPKETPLVTVAHQILEQLQEGNPVTLSMSQDNDDISFTGIDIENQGELLKNTLSWLEGEIQSFDNNTEILFADRVGALAAALEKWKSFFVAMRDDAEPVNLTRHIANTSLKALLDGHAGDFPVFIKHHNDHFTVNDLEDLFSQIRQRVAEISKEPEIATEEELRTKERAAVVAGSLEKWISLTQKLLEQE